MRNILLLTDFSKNSINAMRYALQLFQEEICNFYMLHVQDSTSYMSDDLMLAGNESIYNTMVKKSKYKLAKLVIGFESEFKNKNFSYQIIVDYDGLINAINQIKKSKNIDLIVMGTNGVTNAKEVVFGSNTINVIRKVNCPTLVIPEGFKYRIPKEILLPLDLLDSMNGSPFMDAVKFINRFGNTIHILRIKPNNEPSKEENNDQGRIDYFFKKTSYKYHIINHVPIQHAVSCYSQTHAINLIILLVQEESFLERVFMGSPTTQISHKVNVPLLIFHSK